MKPSSTEEDKFFNAIDSNPLGVYVVEEYKNSRPFRTALFSTRGRAKAWMDTREGSCVCCPFVIDEPEFGNITKGQMV